MRAIVQDTYGGPDVLQLRDIDPPTVGDDDVLVRVCAAGVDPGVWHLMTGEPLLTRIMGFGLRRPTVPVRGRDLAGVVEAVGPHVTRFRPGDEVYGTSETGTYAEFAAVPHYRLARRPNIITWEQAAVVPTSGTTALQAVRDCGQVRSGQRVLVIGAAGGVGSFAVQLATALGARVTGVCGTTKTDLVRRLGAADTIDYTRESVNRDGASYDVVIDTAGNRPLSLLRRAMTPHGTLVLVGGEHGGGRVLGGFDRQLRAPIVSLFVGQRLRGLMAKDRADDLDELTRLIDAGEVAPVIDRVFPLADTADAIRHLAHGHAAGKAVITM